MLELNIYNYLCFSVNSLQRKQNTKLELGKFRMGKET